MDQIIAIIAQLPAYLNAVVAVLTAVIALCMLIPGEQPEKALKKVVEVIEKLSRK